MKKSFFPVSAEWVYLHLYGGDLYNGTGADADKMHHSKAVAEMLNVSYSVGEDNGKAGKNRCKKYIRMCAAEMIKCDPLLIVRNRGFYKDLLEMMEDAYNYGFWKAGRGKG